MTLVCPVSLPQSSEGGCVGRFISPEQEHLVSPDGFELLLERIRPGTDQKLTRLPLAFSGRIVGLHRVPCLDRDRQEKSEVTNILDLLLIHTQTADADHLHFKRFDPESQEFSTVSTFTCEGGLGRSLSLTWSSLAVCDVYGSVYGTVAFTNSASRTIYFVDPQDVKSALAYKTNECKGSFQSSTVLHWAAESVVVVVRKRSDQMSYTMEFLALEKRSKNAKSSYKATRMDSHTLPPGLNLSAIGQASDSLGTPFLSAVLSDETVSTFAIRSDGIELVDEKRLDLPQKDHTAADHFSVGRSKSRAWSKLVSQRNTEAYFVSDDGMVLMVHGVGKLNLFKIDELSRDKLLSPLGLGIFKARSHPHNPVQIISINTGKNAGERSVRVDYLKSKSYEFNNAQLLKHEYDPFFGSAFWFSFKGSMSSHLCKMERCISPQLFSIEPYPFTAPVTGVWLFDDRILISTATETQLFELHGSRLTRVISEFESHSRTIAASSGVQVTPDALHLAGGQRVALPFSEAVAAAIDGPRVVVASVDTVAIFDRSKDLQNVNSAKIINFDEVIVDVDCRHSKLAISTASSLHVLDLESGERTTCKLRELCTSVACGWDNHIYVGDIAGDVFIWPTQVYVKSDSNPIKSIKRQESSLAVLAGANNSSLIGQNKKLTRLRIGDASDILIIDNAGVLLAVIDGILKICETGLDSSMVPRLFDASKLLHSRPEDVKLQGETIYSFGVAQRKLHKASLSNIDSVLSLDIPAFARSDITDCQIFMLSDTHFIEVAKQEPSGSAASDDDEDDDADDFDDFDTHIFIRLYETQADLGAIHLLAEKDFHLEGDPYEEVVVKFITNERLIIFTHSTSAVDVSIDIGGEGIKLGASASCSEYLYDDHWIPSNDGGVVAVTFSGDVMRITPQQLRDIEPLTNCFRASPTGLGSRSFGSLFEGEDTDEAVFNVLKVAEGSSDSTRLVSTSRAKRGGRVGKVSVVDVMPNKLVHLSNFDIHDPGLSLAAFSARDGKFPRSEDESASGYGALLSPIIAIGTSRGAVYSVSVIQDKRLSDVLLQVQQVLYQSIELLDSPIPQDKNTVDGALLMAALKIPEAEPVFANAGLDAVELRKALESLVY